MFMVNRAAERAFSYNPLMHSGLCCLFAHCEGGTQLTPVPRPPHPLPRTSLFNTPSLKKPHRSPGPFLEPLFLLPAPISLPLLFVTEIFLMTGLPSLGLRILPLLLGLQGLSLYPPSPPPNEIRVLVGKVGGADWELGRELSESATRLQCTGFILCLSWQIKAFGGLVL